jgi:transposase, IS5 family
VIKALFERFEGYLQRQGYAIQGRQIQDATLIPVPKQRNQRKENEQIAQGEVPEEWAGKFHQISPKDRDARWTKKNGASHVGSNDQINIDHGYGFIRRFLITDAAEHDSRVLADLLDDQNEGNQSWADSAYCSQAIEEVLALLDFEHQINERGYRNRPLSETQKETNRDKSMICAKVEHVFGHWVMAKGGRWIRCQGLQPPAQAKLGLKNFTYNLKWFVVWESQLAVE